MRNRIFDKIAAGSSSPPLSFQCFSYGSEEFISGLAESPDRFRVHYYTCHCTGELAFFEMKNLLKGNLDYLSAGGQIQITDNGSYLKNPKEFSQKDLTKISNRRTIIHINIQTNERTDGSSLQPRGSPMKIAIIGCEKEKVSVLLKYLKKNRKDAVDDVSDFWLYPYTAENVEEAFRDLRRTPEKGITV